MTIQHIVMFSGGIGSWACADRVKARFGARDMTLLFTDTLSEHQDLYRFLSDAAANIGAPLIQISEGRTPFQVFRDERFLGNSSVDPCSKILKRRLADRWLKSNCDPTNTVIYVGIDWSESHRFDDGKGHGLRVRRAEDGWRYEAPLTEPPYLTKREMLAHASGLGLQPSSSYADGFAHDNCRGLCCKAGQGQFAHLLRVRPDVYAEGEREENSLRDLLGDVSMMTDRTGDGKKKPLTMTALRQRIEAGGQIDMFDIGGCGCFVDDDA